MKADPPGVQESFDLSYQRILALRSSLLLVARNLLQSDHVTVDADGIPLVQLVHRPRQPDLLLRVPRILRDRDADERQQQSDR